MPRWAPSGREVFYRAADNAVMAVTVTAAATEIRLVTHFLDELRARVK